MLWELACSARRIHLMLLDRAIGLAETRGSCLYASALLASMVNRFSAWEARVCGGSWCAADGQRQGHYWVQARLNEAQFVLDISADQFGAPEVLVVPILAAQNWQPDDSVCIDEHLAEEELKVLREKAAITRVGCASIDTTSKADVRGQLPMIPRVLFDSRSLCDEE